MGPLQDSTIERSGHVGPIAPMEATQVAGFTAILEKIEYDL